jgi:hypothetical protein
VWDEDEEFDGLEGRKRMRWEKVQWRKGRGK